MIVHILTLKYACLGFTQLLERESGWSIVRSQYETLKSLTHLINKTVGIVFTSFAFESILYVSLILHNAFPNIKTLTDFPKLILVVINVVNTWTVLLIAANIPHKV